MPQEFNTYFEPFLGSAALFWTLRPRNAVLSDANSELINVYTCVRDRWADVEKIILDLNTDRETYYQIRAARPTEPHIRAAYFIYLNKLCWNGLYRVNLKGEFNVPYGANQNSAITIPGNLELCSSILGSSKIKIQRADFSESLTLAKEGDFVFLDPPYVTSHNNNGFIEYNENIFSWDDQVRLSELSKSLISRGVHVLVTNANHSAVRDLYCGMRIVEIERTSTLASNKKFRGKITEIAILGRGQNG